VPGLLVAFIILLVKLAEVGFGISLASYGLRPRLPEALPGIISFPFIHADWLHLFSNLVPFIFLSVLIFNLFPRLSFKIYLFTFGLSGFWTWCFARPGIVIGASGWVYALLGFILVAGFSRMSRKTMVVAGGLAFLYGGMVEGLVPYRPHVSWEGHLMGLLAGALAAVYWRRELKKEEEAAMPQQRNPEPEPEPPYPYWLYDGPHVVDRHRRVIHPDELIWENGRPFFKPKEEITSESAVAETVAERPTEEDLPAQPGTTTYTQGMWTITLTK